MRIFTQHPTDEQIQEYIDARHAVPEVKEHMESCSRCRQVLRVMARVEHGLKTLPPERTREQFTESILARLRPGSSSPLLFRLLGSVASLVGLFIVLAVMLGVFLFTGVIEMGQVTEGGTKAQQIFQEAGGVVSAQVGALTALLKEYLPFAFGSGSIGITRVVLLVVSALAVADRVFGRRYIAR